MTLAKFVVICTEQLGATRPPVDQLLQFKYVKFPSFRDAKIASDLIYEMDSSTRFKILDNGNHAMLQFVNPSDKPPQFGG